MWLLALIGCAEHIFGSRVTPCDDLDGIVLIATDDLSFTRVPGPTCELRTDATVGELDTLPAGLTDGDVFVGLEGVAWAELTGDLPEGASLRVAFDGTLELEDEGEVEVIDGELIGTGELTYGPRGLEGWCNGCGGSLATALPVVSATFTGGGPELCGDRGGAVTLDGSELTLGVGGREPWSVVGAGTVVVEAPLGFVVDVQGSVVATDGERRTTTCFGDPLDRICPDFCDVDPCQVSCAALCDVACPEPVVSASVDVHDAGFDVTLDGPRGTYQLGVFDRAGYLDEACLDGAPGAQDFWKSAPWPADPTVSSCHVLTPGSTTFASGSATSFDSGWGPLTFVLLGPDGGCWTGGDQPALYQQAYPGCVETLHVQSEDPEDPTPHVSVSLDDAWLQLTVTGLDEPVLFGAIEHGDEGGGVEAYALEDCVGNHVCHPMSVDGGWLSVAHPGEPALAGAVTALGPTGLKSWLLIGEFTGHCWTWGHDPTAWAGSYTCGTPLFVDVRPQ